MFQNLHDAIELISEGGVQVITLLPEEVRMDSARPASIDQYKGKVFDRQGIRTLIQLDSDYVTVLSPAVLSMPELLKRHSDAVHARLTIFQRIQTWAHYIWIPIFIVFEVFSIFILGTLSDELNIVTVAIVSAVGVGFIARARRLLARVSMRLVLQLAKYYVRCRVQRFVSKQLK
ncbi:hypothetical protein SAMN05216308_101679 [Nitrosospira sp. Nsp13]|nr:hypothetical protein SAMN05216308_101679 [Nitrosospira sp. Nsp13]